MPAPVQAVHGRPLLEGFLAVKEHEPVSELVPPTAQHTRHFEKKRGAGATVVCSHEPHTIESGRVVVTGENDNGPVLSMKYADYVGHGNVTDWRQGHKGIIPNLGA